MLFSNRRRGARTSVAAVLATCSAATVLLFAATGAHAGTAGPVKPKNIYFMANGVVMAYVEGLAPTPLPVLRSRACATR